MKTIAIGDVITLKAGSKINFFVDNILNSGYFSVESGTLLKDVLAATSDVEVENIELIEIDAKNVYRKC